MYNNKITRKLVLMKWTLTPPQSQDYTTSGTLEIIPLFEAFWLTTSILGMILTRCDTVIILILSLPPCHIVIAAYHNPSGHFWHNRPKWPTRIHAIMFLSIEFLLYTEILEVKLFAYTNRLFHEDFSPSYEAS